MARVSDAEVREIIDVDSSITSLTPFITIANLLVDEKLLTSNLSETLLKEIERWLSAHFVAIRDPRAKSESIGGISVSYQGQTGTGLEATQFGQQAMVLDPTGILASSGMRKASVETIGWDQE